MHAGGQCLRRRFFKAASTSVSVPRACRPFRGKAGQSAPFSGRNGVKAWRRSKTPGARLRGIHRAGARAARCSDVAFNAAALIATGDIQPGQYWAFRPGVSRLYPLTSPIRRYPDLLVHRAIRAILKGRAYRPRKSAALRHLPASAPSAKTSVWQSLGLHCSANERRADEATRDVEAWLKCQFMLDKRGEIYEGAVSGVTAFGLFVTLEPLFVEGLVHIST